MADRTRLDSFLSDNKSKNLTMADRRKQIKEIYAGDDEGLRRVFNRATGSGSQSIYTEAYLDRIIAQVGLESISKEYIRWIANFAYSTDPNFTTLIDYFSNMFLWRYYYFPKKVKETTNDSNYEEMYNLMTSVVDGLSIEVTFPTIMTKLNKEGAVYIYTEKNTPSKTISTLLLNPSYCAPVAKSQYGTGIFRFDLKYFQDLGLRGEELEEILEYFPKDLVKAYKSWQSSGKEQYIILDGRYSTYIQLNENSFPNKLAAVKSLFDYKKYRANEVERSTAQLDRIITHKIPSYENNLLFELPEVKALHQSMSKSISSNSRTKLMTTFGEVTIHPLQGESSVQNQALSEGFDNIYRTSGLNPNLFSGALKEALEISLTRDEASMWRYVQELINFYNVAINNLYNFKGYQISLAMLPMTHYNSEKMMDLYRKNSEYGVGKLETIVASGTKQENIVAKSEVEEFLRLDEILKPLKSSHTQSGDEEPVKKDEDDEKDDSNSPADDVEENDDSDTSGE